jgi:hypothetical protein
MNANIASRLDKSMRRGQNDPKKRHAKTKAQNKHEARRNERFSVSQAESGYMDIAYQACFAFAALGAVAVTILLYYHQQTPACWTTFATIVFVALGICCLWQDKIWKAAAKRGLESEAQRSVDQLANLLSKLPRSTPPIAQPLPSQPTNSPITPRIERTQDKTSTENRLFDFHVLRDSGLTLQFEVWYFYDGVLGNEDISIDVTPLKDGQPLPGGATMIGAEISVIGHKALATIQYTYKPMNPNANDKSTHIQLGMSHLGENVVCRNVFRYPKTWKATATNPSKPTPGQEETSEQDAGRPIRTIPFPDRNPCLEYVRDVFYGVVWQWHYKAELGRKPLGLVPLCPECVPDVPLTIRTVGDHSIEYTVELRCPHPFHRQVYAIPAWHNRNDDFARVKDLISECIENGSWQDHVDEQRARRGY